MSLVEDELKIIEIKELLEINLTLPLYQRPYRWSVRAANDLFIDTYRAFKNDVGYRLGSVILHKEDDEKYNIVDGQQRLTTLSILLYCLGDREQRFLEQKYPQRSIDFILSNFRTLKGRTEELSEDERQGYKEYLLKRCTMVQIVTNNLQESFQFFDSQNNRGKALEAHDLLKAYHLRAMNDKDEVLKFEIINQWEKIEQSELKKLFENYLYPVIQWHKGRKNGLGDYSAEKMDCFKGIREDSLYNYSIYHTGSHLFMEQSCETLNQFQLTQPLIAGRRFFDYTSHYRILLEKVRNEIDAFFCKEYNIQIERNKYGYIENLGYGYIMNLGDAHVMNLYECASLFFADHFGIKYLTDPVMKKLYSWSFSLRLAMSSVSQKTINSYAVGQHEVLNYGMNLFALISEMKEPEELNLLAFQKPKMENNDKKDQYHKIYELLREWNGW